MHARFYAPDLQQAGELVVLPREEAEHLSRVLRLDVGANVRVFDGRGHEFAGVVDSVTKRAASVRVGPPVGAAPELPISLTLAPAMLKGEKMDDIVRDAVMLGVTAIQPLVTARTEVPQAVLERGRRRARWERIAISSVKQCGRAVVPAVAERLAFEDALRTMPAPVLMLVEPGAAATAVALRDLDPAPPPRATIVVGPEGGWTPPEIASAASSWQLVSLGAITLRADAAPAIAIAALLARWRVI